MAVAEFTDLKEITGTWAVDPGHSSLGFSAKHMVFSTVRGNFGEFEGGFTIVEDAASSSAWARIKADSITTNQPDRDAHLRSGDFIESEAHPELIFESTRFEPVSDDRGTLEGILTIKGVSRPVSLEVVFNGFLAKDLFGNARASFSATGSFSRKDFGLTWNKALETGGVLVGDEVRLDLEIAAVRQDV